MSKRNLIIYVLGLSSAAVCLFSFQNDAKLMGSHSDTFQKLAIDSSEQIYQNFCSGCHGEQMEAFVDRQWKHGNAASDLFMTIKSGYANGGMPAFGSAFSDEVIRNLSTYIISGIEKGKKYLFQNVPAQNHFSSNSFDFKLDTVVSGMKVPWGIVFLPDGSMLFTERSGKLFRSVHKGSVEEISGLPDILAEGQSGLMDIVLHPKFSANHILYLSYSAFKKTDGSTISTTAILKATLEGNVLTHQTVIFEALPYAKAKHNNGSRMVFGTDGKLYFSVGDRGNEKENPQSLYNDLGKIHRINDDGTVPEDNPFVHIAGAKPSIYSYGHRNPQGLYINKVTGQIWSHEHGPRGGDELNLIKKGANYGWPVITYGINYNGKIISKISALEGMEQPIHYWTPSIAPSGMSFVTGNRYPGWKDQLLIGSLRFKYLNLCHMKGNKVESEEILMKNIGRVRDVRMGPDGYIYVSVENPGYIFRLIPLTGKGKSNGKNHN